MRDRGRASAISGLTGLLLLLLVTSALAATPPNQCVLSGVTGGYITESGALGAPTQVDPAALTDGNLGTGYSFSGQENPVVDTGGWLLLDFQCPVTPDSLYVEIKAQSYGGISGPFLLMSPVNNWYAYGSYDSAFTITTLGVLVAPGVNRFNVNGNWSDSSTLGDPPITVADTLLPGNHFQVRVWGPYIAGLHDSDAQGVSVFEAAAQFNVPVPEPPSVWIGMLGVGGMLLAWRNSRRFKWPSKCPERTLVFRDVGRPSRDPDTHSASN